jgi:hypothetical protein
MKKWFAISVGLEGSFLSLLQECKGSVVSQRSRTTHTQIEVQGSTDMLQKLEGHYSVYIVAFGDFSIESSDNRRYIEPLFETIQSLGLWEWFKGYKPSSKGFTYDCLYDPNLSRIVNITEDRYEYYSGAATAFGIKYLQQIAKMNWNTYVEECIKNTQ